MTELTTITFPSPSGSPFMRNTPSSGSIPQADVTFIQ